MPDRVSALVYSADGSGAQTVADLLVTGIANEIVVVLDGAWADPPLPADPRVVTIFRGQRLGWSEAVLAATATWVTHDRTLNVAKDKETNMAKTGSLVIVRAIYGIGQANDEYVDVTKALAEAVGSAATIELKVTNDALKANAPAPFAGRRKRLWVDYTLNGVAGSANALERKTLRIPPAQG